MTALEVRLIAYAILTLMVIGGSIWVGAHFTALHYQVIIQKEHDAQAQLAATAALAAKAKQDAADAHNREVYDGLQTQLADNRARADELARRLRNAETAGSHLPKGPGGPGTAATPQAPGPDRLTGLLGDALAECFDNESRQEALIAELKPQL